MVDGLSHRPCLWTVRQKLTTVREYNSPAARANASSYGVGSNRSRQTSYRFLVFDVLLDDGKGSASYGCNKVAIGPQGRQAALSHENSCQSR